MEKQFKQFLIHCNLAKNTTRSYVSAMNRYFKLFTNLDKSSLLEFKEYCQENFQPSTVNSYINAINRYLEYRKLDKLKMKRVKIQQKSFLENVISNEDYAYFKACLKREGDTKWYFMVWFMGATGARISELIQIKAEHVKVGYLDLYSKGGKTRRLYIPRKLRKEASKWLENQKQTSGFIFLNRFRKQISEIGIAKRLKYFAKKYGIPLKVVHPHSFRHRFAKNFLEKYNDIALLADLMGHESIETTRIYLRMTASEQQSIVDRVVTW
jgi:integrase